VASTVDDSFESSVLTAAAFPETSTISLAWPTCILASTRVIDPALTVTALLLNDRKPPASTATSYSPAGSSFTVYAPEVLVVVLTDRFVPLLVTITFAPAIAAPEGSV